MRQTAVIAHRGASHEAPENTLAAFRLAWEQGADGIEGDFRLTADSAIVCIHDATTSRTTGVCLTVAGSTLAQLRELDAGKMKGDKWCGERIPTLKEVVATVPRGKKLFIELKSGTEILLPVQAVLADTEPRWTTILSFNEQVVAEARQLMPQVKALWSVAYEKGNGGSIPSLGQILQTLERIDASGLASQAHPCIDAAFIGALKDAGRELHVWTVNDPLDAARLVALGVDSIITDHPGWQRSGLNNLTSGLPA